MNIFHKKAIEHFARYGYAEGTTFWRKIDFIKRFNELFFYKEKRKFTFEEKLKMLEYLKNNVSFLSYTPYTIKAKLQLIEDAKNNLK